MGLCQGLMEPSGLLRFLLEGFLSFPHRLRNNSKCVSAWRERREELLVPLRGNLPPLFQAGDLLLEVTVLGSEREEEITTHTGRGRC